MTLRLGTRRSRLALTQSGLVAAELERAGHRVELVEIVTQGDRDTTSALSQLGGTGVFVSALREALANGEIDLAVHSLKDLPTAPDPRVRVAAIPGRADPRDALVAADGATLSTLARGAAVGTGSPRRAAQLLAARPDLRVVGLRGNIDTRLEAVRPGSLDAVVLAAAGLERIQRAGLISEYLDPDLCCPAPGQGALAIEVRTDGRDAADAVAPLDDAEASAAVRAERAVLATMEAGCSAPVGALATASGGQLLLRAIAGAVDGSLVLREEATGPLDDPEGLGGALARALLARGAHDLAGVTGPVSSREAAT